MNRRNFLKSAAGWGVAAVAAPVVAAQTCVTLPDKITRMAVFDGKLLAFTPNGTYRIKFDDGIPRMPTFAEWYGWNP